MCCLLVKLRPDPEKYAYSIANKRIQKKSKVRMVGIRGTLKHRESEKPDGYFSFRCTYFLSSLLNIILFHYHNSARIRFDNEWQLELERDRRDVEAVHNKLDSHLCQAQ